MFKNKKGFIIKLRQSRTFKGMSVCLALNFLFQITQPSVSLALTEGPSQPEVQSFEPIGTTQMVDMFTGDFNYNIPLFNLPGPNGGYPVNLAYHAGATMDDEASTVGLGWNINVGSLVRSMRGLPDEFMSVDDDGDDDPNEPEDSDGIASTNRDYLEVQKDMKQSWTVGLNGSLSTEVFGADLQFGIGASVYFNNYNGIGMSVDPTLTMGSKSADYSLGLSLDSENGLGVTASASIDKQRGHAMNTFKLSVSFDGDLSVQTSLDRKYKGTYIGEDAQGNSLHKFDQRLGIGIGSSISFARNNYLPSSASNIDKYNFGFSIKMGTAGSGFFPYKSWGMFFNTEDYSKTDKEGRRTMVVGYAEAGDEVYSNGHAGEFTRDFMRENLGQITKSTMFLPVAQYAYDTYNSTGQGLAGYFRPRRSDVGLVYDPHIVNHTIGGNFAYDFGTLLGTHIGASGGVNFGWESQGRWGDDNDLDQDFSNPRGTGGINENVYYQVHGESTVLDDNELGYMNGLNLPFIRLTEKSEDDLAGGKRKISFDTGEPVVHSQPNEKYKNARSSSNRVVRNTLVHNLKNGEVSHLGEFKVKYFDNKLDIYSNTGRPQNDLDRTERKEVNISNHPAGYKVLNAEGSYYVYGLPAYNNKEVENLFSVENTNLTPDSETEILSEWDQPNGFYKVNHTDKFINKTTKTPYAHSYLLTSVQGADYVDIDNNGPSDTDLGYWVKFNYLRHTDSYKWRSPYQGNQYIQGNAWTSTDDKGSYQYGEKELWYMGQIETKSHIAVFVMEDRTDMKEAQSEFFDGVSQSVNKGLKLKEIKLYEKKAFLANPSTAVPLQTVHFNYAEPINELCKGVYNGPDGVPNPTNPATFNNGKLTLESVYFTSNGSTRGELNKYKFDYKSPEDIENPSNNVAPLMDNPNYATNSYDSWGVYKPKGTSFEQHSRFPYVNQFNQDWGATTWEPNYGNSLEDSEAKKLTQKTQNELVSAWALKKITLPSGGEINIQYESDDYGYVQHKAANQMFKISKLGDFSNDNEVYSKSDEGNDNDGDYYNTSTNDDERRRRIYFKLENPIPISNGSANEEIYSKYVLPIIQDENNQRNLYFKTKMKMVDNIYDYVSGYLPLENNLKIGEHYNFGVKSDATATIDGVECYTNGFVTVQAAKRQKLDESVEFFTKFHPLAIAGWTYLQTDAQMLLHNSGGIVNMGNDPSANDWMNQLSVLASIIPETASSFRTIRHYCHKHDMARYIDLDKSVIRLASPDKKKYGGGHRVKEISISDNWSSDINGDSEHEDRSYGQHYDYTIEENGELISSGVAQYEPQAGGDENALKYPAYYFDKQNTHTRNNLFAEAPFNENLFPGASVGYRQVTVKSINTNDRINQAKVSSPELRGRTGGVTVHKFYTAKEFPTLVTVSKLSEENSTKDVFNLLIPVPFVGSLRRNYYHGTQAYMIELNDMHGKPMSVESFQMNGYEIDPNPITSSSYEYQSEPYQYGKDVVMRLNNNVDIIANDGTHQVQGLKKLMGVEVDLFTDQRQSKSFNNSGSFDPNVDVFFNFLPAFTPSFWVTYSNSKTLFRTYVTNKVIHKTGILKKTKTRDLQTVNETEILAYDEKSGNPLLSRIKNEFGDDFYSYNIPAYYAYDRMGHAYQNINYNFSTVISSTNDNTQETVRFAIEPDQIDHLVRGDEFLIGTSTLLGTSAADNHKKGYFIGFDYSTDGVTPTYGIMHVPGGLQDENGGVTLRVIRSGYRNHYSSIAANYLTKGKLTDVALTDYDVASVDNGPMIKTKKIAGNVLSATASLYKDDWLTSDIGEDVSEKVVDNPFLTGNSGIFRPYKSYTYVGPRKQKTDFTKRNTNTPTNADAELYNDGVMENVPMFTWEIGNLENYVSNWEWMNEVTKYNSDAYEVENVNRLGIYSSALYGYDNSLTIGVGGNSSYFELGVVDFETVKRVDSQGEVFNNEWEFGESMKQTNLNFYNVPKSMSEFITSEHYDIRSATYNSDGKIVIETTIPYAYYTSVLGDIEDNFGITLNSTKNNALAGNKGMYFNAECNRDKMSGGSGTSTCYSSVNLMINGQSVACTKLILSPFYAESTRGFKLMKTNSLYTGKISLLLNKQITAGTVSTSTTQFVTNKAHTGKKSMKLNSTVHYDQFKLKVIKDKKYVVSMWISRDNTNVPRYASSSSNPISIGQINSGAFEAITDPTRIKYTFGKIVEGWQKVDVEFSIPEDGKTMSIQFAPGTSSLYVDDIRFSPKTGGITTYVYDPMKFWLRASLNVDNYATLFFYDEEGNLTLKKQETEEGIFTITESRGHVSEDDN